MFLRSGQFICAWFPKPQLYCWNPRYSPDGPWGDEGGTPTKSLYNLQQSHPHIDFLKSHTDRQMEETGKVWGHKSGQTRKNKSYVLHFSSWSGKPSQEGGLRDQNSGCLARPPGKQVGCFWPTTPRSTSFGRKRNKNYCIKQQQQITLRIFPHPDSQQTPWTSLTKSTRYCRAELEKSGNLGTRFLVHFRPKFGK